MRIVVAVVYENVEQLSRRISGLGGWKENCEPHCSVFSNNGVTGNHWAKKPSGTGTVRTGSRKNGLHIASMKSEETSTLLLDIQLWDAWNKKT